MPTRRLTRFLVWLFPARYSLYATCKLCGRLRLKTEMHCSDSLYGRFCTEEEEGIFWLRENGDVIDENGEYPE
jgi:hypothetical protein